jgi:hypothetical protein
MIYNYGIYLLNAFITINKDKINTIDISMAVFLLIMMSTPIMCITTFAIFNIYFPFISHTIFLFFHYYL